MEIGLGKPWEISLSAGFSGCLGLTCSLFSSNLQLINLTCSARNPQIFFISAL